MMRSAYSLVRVENPSDWEAYHRIRKAELFDAKGRLGIYDPNRAEERSEANVPLLLKCDGEPVGTTRLDVRPDDSAVLRLVAVARESQGRGHGRELARQVERLARDRGIGKLLVNAAPDAVGFYERLGFVRDDWDPSELIGISAHSIQMSKRLTN